MIANPGGGFELGLKAAGLTLEIKEISDVLTTCTLPHRAEKAQLSYDKSAIIISDREFISVSSLRDCHKSKIQIRKIPSNVGAIVDINIKNDLYLALDLISTSPLSFLSTVSHLTSSKNLSSLPGAYVAGRNLSKLQEQGFSYDPESAQPRISKSGRYVSPSGIPDCSENAYPGVWDLNQNKKVSFGKNEDEVTERCDALFE